MKPSEMAFSSNSKWQTRNERKNRSTNKGDMAKGDKRPVSESVTSNNFLLFIYFL